MRPEADLRRIGAGLGSDELLEDGIEGREVGGYHGAVGVASEEKDGPFGFRPNWSRVGGVSRFIRCRI